MVPSGADAQPSVRTTPPSKSNSSLAPAGTMPSPGLDRDRSWTKNKLIPQASTAIETGTLHRMVGSWKRGILNPSPGGEVLRTPGIRSTSSQGLVGIDNKRANGKYPVPGFEQIQS